MLQIFGEALLLLVGQGRVEERREVPGRARRTWRRPKGTPRLG